MPGKLSRSWCYTINNYTDDTIVALESLDCIRHVCGREVGSQGTPHLQGYIRFAKPKRFSWWKRNFPTAHVEMRRGKETEASGYCKKEGDVVIDKGYDTDKVDEYGTVGEETDAVIEEIESGEKFGQIRKRHKRFFFHHRSKIVTYMYDEAQLDQNPDYSPCINDARLRVV